MTVLTDGTITLRPPRVSDAAAVADAVRASLAELAPWLAWATPDYDEASARAWITGGEEHPFVIVDSGAGPGGGIVGSCGVNGVDETDGRANLGYWIRSDRTGRGVATRAARLVARHALTTLGLTRLEIVVAVDNHASRRVAQRLGAVHERVLPRRLVVGGRVHDAHLHVLTEPPS